MRTKLLCFAMVLNAASFTAHADDSHKEEHGGQIFHAFRLEADTGIGNDDTITSWDVDGWVGTDENKLWLVSEGEMADGASEQSEFWALYSRNIATFWDAQIGMRYDAEPESTPYLAAGFEGLAPYFFETEAHLFISDAGDMSARLRQENDFLITQQLVLQPYIEANFYLQDVEEQHKGSGLADAEFGLQARYEMTRKFAPYIDVRYERSFGETVDMAKEEGDGIDDVVVSAGIRLLF